MVFLIGYFTFSAHKHQCRKCHWLVHWKNHITIAKEMVQVSLNKKTVFFCLTFSSYVIYLYYFRCKIYIKYAKGSVFTKFLCRYLISYCTYQGVQKGIFVYLSTLLTRRWHCGSVLLNSAVLQPIWCSMRYLICSKQNVFNRYGQKLDSTV